MNDAQVSSKPVPEVVAVLAIPLGWLACQIQIVRERKELLEEIRRFSSPGAFTELGLNVLEGKRAGGEFPLPEYCRVLWIRRCLGDSSYVGIVLPAGLPPTLIERAEYAFPESSISISVGTEYLGASRDSLYAPLDYRWPNKGTIFKTGLIEK